MPLTLEIIPIHPVTGQVEAVSELPVSAPAARIDLVDAWLEPETQGKKLHRKWILRLTGKVTCGVCDTVAGAEGAIHKLLMFEGFNDFITEIPLSVSKNDGINLARPYPYEGRFDFRLPLPHKTATGRPVLYQRNDVFNVIACEGTLGRLGHLMIGMEKMKPVSKGQSADAIPVEKSSSERQELIIDRYIATQDFFFHPLLCRVHPAGDAIESTAVSTQSGNRPIVRGSDGYFYLADITGSKPQVLLLLSGDIKPPFMCEAPSRARSPLRLLPDAFPPDADGKADRFESAFRAGFLDEELWLMAGRDKLATLTLRRDVLSANYDDPLQFEWNWGAKSPKQSVPSPTRVAAPWVDRAAQLVFANLHETGIERCVVIGNWKKLGMDGYPDEQRRVLDFSPNVFCHLYDGWGKDFPVDASRLCGQTYREMLSFMAPLSQPRICDQQTLLGKLQFLEGFNRSGQSP